MTVYIAQQPAPRANGWTPDLTSAVEFGKIVYVFNGGESVYALPGPSMKKAQSLLKDFDPENDYFLWPNTGDPAALWTCCFAISALGFSKIRILYWSRKRTNGQRDHNNGYYSPITYDLKRMV